MADARYYVVGDRDVWMIKFEDGESGPYASRDEAVVFAVDAAQNSERGGSAPTSAWWMMMAASDRNGPTIWIIICAGARYRLRRSRHGDLDGRPRHREMRFPPAKYGAFAATMSCRQLRVGRRPICFASFTISNRARVKVRTATR